MGIWSKLVGDVFLDWLEPPSGQKWIDVGCGNGAFTETLISRAAPCEVHAIDSSAAQLAYAKGRVGTRMAEFTIGDAMKLEFEARSFDAAVMALVIFFVPDPITGVREMARVVRPGGIVSAYAWDLVAGGLPLQPLHREMIAIGLKPPMPPRPEASTIEGLAFLWTEAGLCGVETRTIAVERTFANFDEMWDTLVMSPGVAPMIAGLPTADLEKMKKGLGQGMTPDSQGCITYSSVANAVKGQRPH
jgi:SAM-dependent methyltransferase